MVTTPGLEVNPARACYLGTMPMVAGLPAGGGPAMVVAIILLLAFLILLHEAGHYLAARSVGVPVRQFGIGFGPALWSRTWAGTRFRLNLIPFGGYCDLSLEGEEDADGMPRDALEGRSVPVRMWVMVGGILFNVIGGWLCLTTQLALQGIPRTTPLDIEREGIVIQQVASDRARAAGLKDGDRVLAVGGNRLRAIEDFGKALKPRAGASISLEVRRTEGTLTATRSLIVTPDANGKLGVAISPPADVRYVPADGVTELVAAATKRTWDISLTMVQGLGMLVTGKLPLETVGGPVAIVHLGSRMVHNLVQILFFAALINLNLAVVNFLPLPALDGGRLLLLLVEAVLRRPLPRRLEGTIHSVGMAAMLGLIALITLKDVLDLFRS
ncbi:MAG: RIP metalloprotease RseP [Candidatus Sericytochromatia bacterium]|nr:RIP metalloprotease RseP [Candidatus Sericytochromatia bacterium]